MRNKSGQLLERPFIIIFVMVVAAMVFIFGFYLINNLLKAGTCSQLGLAVDDLKKEVNRYYNFDTGSSTKFKLKLPSKIEYACFKNTGEEANRFELDKVDKRLYPVLKDSKYNVIFVPINYCRSSFFKIDKLMVSEGTLCVLNSGGIDLTLENKGDFVELS